MTSPVDNDEVLETTAAKLRTAMMAASQAAQRLSRAREQQMRKDAADSSQQAAELKVRLEAQRQTATALTAPTRRDDWWDTATTADIAAAYEVAHAWEDIDPTLHRDAERIRSEVHDRYGISPTDLSHSDSLTQEAAAQRGEAREDINAAVVLSGDSAADLAEGGQADSGYQSATQEREAALWDSTERREQMASDLEGVASEEEVDVRMVVATGNGHPAREAVNPRAAGTTSAPNRGPAQKITQRPTRRPTR